MYTRRYIGFTVCFAVGLLLGGAAGSVWSRWVITNNDFPYTVQLDAICSDVIGHVEPETSLKLLDIYEAEVRKQMWGGGKDKFWQQALVGINLRRYVLYTKVGRNDVAEQMLVRAALISCPGPSPSAEKLELFRQVALKSYTSN